MESVLANPASLTPLALLGLVAIQLLQLIGNQLKARADVAARHDDNLAGILKQVLDQQNARSRTTCTAPTPRSPCWRPGLSRWSVS